MGTRATMRRRRRTRCRGVTITEAVVAAGLLLACVVPLLRALTTAQAADRAMERKSWSLLLAQQQLEQLRARCAENYDASYRADSVPLREGYLCSIDDDEAPALRTVTVSVGLDRDENGILSPAEVEVRLSTRLARGGPGPQL
jgi:Tfp pilus assembly protein PilV